MRELVVLGTASQVPTRYRNHNGYLLRWDDEGLLFDPGEGTQRQMVLAGVAASAVNRLCLTHFHGDHCLGVPGIIQRASLDRVGHPITAHFPASGASTSPGCGTPRCSTTPSTCARSRSRRAGPWRSVRSGFCRRGHSSIRPMCSATGSSSRTAGASSRSCCPASGSAVPTWARWIGPEPSGSGTG